MAAVKNSFTTESGTELPLINLKGKSYLQVAHRLVWFRERYPDGIIKTQLMAHADDTAVFKAEVFVTAPNGQPMMVSSAHKTENKSGFKDYLEKAETGAIGRALALAGIGTQFCETDLDEGDRLADAPVTPAAKKTKSSSKSSFRNSSKKVVESASVGDDI